VERCQGEKKTERRTGGGGRTNGGLKRGVQKDLTIGGKRLKMPLTKLGMGKKKRGGGQKSKRGGSAKIWKGRRSGGGFAKGYDWKKWEWPIKQKKKKKIQNKKKQARKGCKQSVSK